MTPEDPESRRIAEALERRERRRPETEAPPVDHATLAALLEKHEGKVARIIGQAEEALVEKIDKLVAAQGADAESLGREISGSVKGDFDKKIAGLKREISGLRTVVEELPAGLGQQFKDLKKSIDKREGGVFAGIDGVAENVKPAADALRELQQTVAGTTAAASDVAAIREAVVDSRQAVDEVVTIRKTVANSDKAIADVVAMRPVLRSVAAGLETWGTNTRRLRRFGWTLLVVLSLLFCAGGILLQRETGIWPPTAGSDEYWRDLIWEHYRAQIVACIRAGLTHEPGMTCTIRDIDP